MHLRTRTNTSKCGNLNETNSKAISISLFFPTLLLSAVTFWLGTRAGLRFLIKRNQTESPPSENPNRVALRAVARRGFAFEHDIERGNLREVESKKHSQNLKTNLKAVLVHHPIKRQKFRVTLQRTIVMPNGTPEQIEIYRQLIIAGELATSTVQKQAIEKEKKRVLSGMKVAPTIQTNSSSLNITSQ